MLDLVSTGPTMGDATTPYRVRLDRTYTVNELVHEIVSNTHNWGTIRISDDPSDRYGKTLYNYRYGQIINPHTNEIIDTLPDTYADVIVQSAHGAGGYTAYDFTLMI